MDDLTVIFEEQRTHLRAVAYRLVGSVHEDDDAVQETWLRLERSDVSDVDNLAAWLTTVVSRICLRRARRAAGLLPARPLRAVVRRDRPYVLWARPGRPPHRP
jgi:RNA polymerase sigma-70 factor (ECF subfamily)